MSMGDIVWPVGTVEYYPVRVRPKKAGVVYDPTDDPVLFQFVPKGGSLDANEWVTGIWETDADGEFWALCLVGDVAVLGAGTYSVYVSVTDSPEVPQDRVGTLKLY